MGGEVGRAVSWTPIWRPCVYSSRYARLASKVQARISAALPFIPPGSGLAREARSFHTDSSDCFLGQAPSQTDPRPLQSGNEGPGEGRTSTCGVPVSFRPCEGGVPKSVCLCVSLWVRPVVCLRPAVCLPVCQSPGLSCGLSAS